MTVSYGGSNITFDDGSSVSSGWTGFKNRLINGAMTIDQRFGGSANTPASGAYTLDRWTIDKSGSLATTVQQVDDGPTGLHQKSLRVTVPSGTVNSTDYFGVRQVIENSNFYDIGSTWGGANPASFTISFWVKSSLAGTYYFSPRIPSVASYTTPYTINQANTWEYKTITVTGPTNPSYVPGSLTTMNTGTMISVRFWQIAGSSERGGADNTWGISQTVGSGMANLAAAGGTWQITGVQVERGSTASSFEYRPYTTELQLCQRYFEKSWHPNTAVGTADYYGVITSTIPGSTGQYTGTVNMSVSKRSTAPTVTFYNPSSGATGTSRGSNGSNYTTTVYWYTSGTTFSFNISSFPAGSNFTFHWTCSDEL